MSHVRTLTTALVLLSAASLDAQDTPRVDHHQHLFSPALAAAVSKLETFIDAIARATLARLHSTSTPRAWRRP